VACPGHKDFLAGALEGSYDRYGVEGVVRVRIRLRGNQILDVTALSGPREYYRLVTAAVRRMKCQVLSGDEVEVPLEISFHE